MNSFQARIERAKSALSGEELAYELKDVYSWYLSYEKKKHAAKDVIIAIYESQILDLPSMPVVWIEYYEHFLHESFCGFELLQDIISRALEAHPLYPELWVRQIELIELKRQQPDPSFISETVSRVASVYSDPRLVLSLVIVFNSIIDYISRILQRKALAFEQVHPSLDKMISIKDSMYSGEFAEDGAVYPSSSDFSVVYSSPLFELEKKVAWLMILHSDAHKDDFKRVFETKILRIRAESIKPETWLEYVSMARFRDPYQHAVRSLYKRASQLVEKSKQDQIFKEWICWERLFGGEDLKPFLECRAHILREKKTRSRPCKRTSPNGGQSDGESSKRICPHPDDESGPDQEHQNMPPEEGSSKSTSSSGNDSSGGKHIFKIFLSNLPYSTTRDHLLGFIAEVVAVPDLIGNECKVGGGHQAHLQSRWIVSGLCLPGSP